MSLNPMSSVTEAQKGPCHPVDFKGQGSYYKCTNQAFRRCCTSRDSYVSSSPRCPGTPRTMPSKDSYLQYPYMSL